MAELPRGDALLVLATDPEAPIDLAAWAADEGHGFREVTEPAEPVAPRPDSPDERGWYVLELRKGGDVPQPTSTAEPPRRGSPPPESSPVARSRATAWTPPK